MLILALKDKRGQGIVEFAIVLPLLVLLLVGFMHMALVLHDYMAMGEATREIARYAVVGKAEADIRNEVKIGMSGFYRMDPKDVHDVEIVHGNNAQLGDFVTVTATMEFDESQGVILTRPFMPDRISTSLTMRKE